MKPAQVSEILRKIATAIDNSANPRRDLVVGDLQRVVVAIKEPVFRTKEEEAQLREDMADEIRDTQLEREWDKAENPEDYDEPLSQEDPPGMEDIEPYSSNTLRKMTWMDR